MGEKLPPLPRSRLETTKQLIKVILHHLLFAALFFWGLNRFILNPVREAQLGLPNSAPSHLSASHLETCAWEHLEPHVGFLNVPPIGRDEFLGRQKVLASALDDAGVDAFIAEPSASSAYYANISYNFHLSERPFLMILDREGQFSYLVPKFEAGRIAGLNMVYRDKKVIEWPEEESPYQVLANATGFSRVMLDEHARFMIAAGLQDAGVQVVPMTESVQSLRAVKTDAEVAILRGINSFTLELVASMQKCISVGMTQETVLTAGEALFSRAGVGEGYWAIILFGDQAAYPHGGKQGKTLGDGEFVLIDIGSLLHGYNSDVTRTILPPGGKVSSELMGIWKTVQAAQSAGFNLMHPDTVCSAVDSASRKPVSEAGYAEFYTHRLGHGLGLEMHEHPYLNGANHEKLKVGEICSNEPGIYVTSEQAYEIGKQVGFGVRLEDPVLVTEKGGVALTGRRAQSPYEP
ncbi:Creatinase/aminopeptidase [Cryphonectria parasitica EP155]|uniref:Creatinase/aminopeptidase n=1 Tax=Cryphonectria parasitica (strain ATCC 38755 / EP155) TaxID=660469 RepID=A0A9P4XX21_CRYP1|nr:Creatinase/aminopeptidase [Cryphonectria parasitica EP155]KAF3762509.1 Creatinase/aminopeptidase [Cryphonectria parasitica EP155]